MKLRWRQRETVGEATQGELTMDVYARMHERLKRYGGDVLKAEFAKVFCVRKLKSNQVTPNELERLLAMGIIENGNRELMSDVTGFSRIKLRNIAAMLRAGRYNHLISPRDNKRDVYVEGYDGDVSK